MSVNLNPSCDHQRPARHAAPEAAALAAYLQPQIGRDSAVSSATIADALGCPKHQVLELVIALQEEGIAVCGGAERGYFIAATPDELADECASLRGRAMRALAAEAALRHVQLYQVIDEMWMGQRDVPPRR